MHIRVLYFAGCPNSGAALALVRDVVAREAVQATVEPVEVKSQDEAIRLRFLGSPTVQIDEEDVEPAARRRSDFSMSCRLYGNSGVPPAGMIAAAIRGASS